MFIKNQHQQIMYVNSINMRPSIEAIKLFNDFKSEHTHYSISVLFLQFQF